MTFIDLTELQSNFEAIMERCIAGEMFTIAEDGVNKWVLLPIAEYQRLTQESESAG